MYQKVTQMLGQQVDCQLLHLAGCECEIYTYLSFSGKAHCVQQLGENIVNVGGVLTAKTE